MRKILLLVVALVAVAAATTAATARDSATITVSITSTGFNPDHVTVKPGDTVTWRNDDTANHQVVSDTGDFKSPVLSKGQTYSHRFMDEASYSYHDGVKPGATGVVDAIASSVTVGLTRLRVVYNNPVRIFGSIPTGASGEQVTVRITPYKGQTETRVVTTTDGTYEFSYRPTIRTTFSATWNGAESKNAPVIAVRPLVIFRPISVAKNRFFVAVRSEGNYARKVVRIQRLNNRGVWITTTRVRLNRNAEARFTGKFARGRTKARAWVTRHPGYTVGFSTTKTITR